LNSKLLTGLQSKYSGTSEKNILIIILIFGISIGIIAALRQYSVLDVVVTAFSFIGLSMPIFFIALASIYVFAVLFKQWGLPYLPANGMFDPKVGKTVSQVAWHLILPALALAMGGLAQEARITRSTMSDNLSKDYIASGRSLGIPENVMMRSFLLKPSLIPTVSILALDFAATMGNAFLVEMIFVWPGLSRYGINAMLRKDLNAIAAVILVLGVVFILVNIIVDLVVARLDPRIRLAPGKGE